MTTKGRPRSERSRIAVLSATRDLLAELGYEKLTMDAIAARSGASKMTIYRWWSSKAAVVAEAAMEGTIPVNSVLIADTGDVRSDFDAWISAAVEGPIDPPTVALALALTAATAGDPRAGGELYERFTQPVRDALITRLRAGIKAGQLSPGADVTTAVDALLALLLYRLVTRAAPEPGDAQRISDLLWSGLSATKATPASS